jgi:dolichol kinase
MCAHVHSLELTSTVRTTQLRLHAFWRCNLTISYYKTAGAIVGTNFGYNKWPGSSRTVQGSIGMALSMYAAYYCYNYYVATHSTAPHKGTSIIQVIYTYCTVIPL